MKENTNNNEISFLKLITMYIVPLLLVSALAIVFFLRSYSFENTNLNTVYNVKGYIDYDVNLLKNSYYKENVLPPNMKYVASIIDTINPSFNYELHASNDINLEYTYDITAKLKIIDYENNDKILQETNEVLLPEVTQQYKASNMTLHEDIKINYKKYSTYVTNFKRGLSLPVKAELVISMNIHVAGNNTDVINDINMDRKLELTIPFNVQTVEVKINTENIDKDGQLLSSVSKITNKKLFIFFIILSITSIILIDRLFFGINRYKKYNRYYKDLNKILRNYDRLIVNGEIKYDENEYKNIIITESFEEMVDASVNLNKPIIFEEDKENKKSLFIIMSDDTLYKYTLENKN